MCVCGAAWATVSTPREARAVGGEHRVGEAGAVVAHDGARVRKERHLQDTAEGAWWYSIGK